MTATGKYALRPAGRLLLTIGRDLIQNAHAAIAELVKNAYDADSPDALIAFRAQSTTGQYTITVTDHGHGMTREDVLTKWLVPSTRDKLTRRISPNGRLMQGRKGVGRYATSLLGSDLLLTTVTPDGYKTEALINWQEFEEAPYLDDVTILVETTTTTQPAGTQLQITGDATNLADWNQDEFDRLIFELRKLQSPLMGTHERDQFDITLTILDLPNARNLKETIEPYPLLDIYDYKITGSINAEGNGGFLYTNQKVRNTTTDHIEFSNAGPTMCGALNFDIRVYDRDRVSIDALIQRGLTSSPNTYLSNLQARQLLNQYNGISVYRHGFRIRPLGDPDFDWLKLNEQRVQNPTLRIGSNQAIGSVEITSEDQSGLIEKSARDGLRENMPFHHLKTITHKIIAELESRRFDSRRQQGLIRPATMMENTFATIYSHSELEQAVERLFDASTPTEPTSDGVMSLIERDHHEKDKMIDEIRETVAIYQGQATLGKIINVIIHEGRRPLSYFRNQIPSLRYWSDDYLHTKTETTLASIVSIIKGISDNAEYLVNLFARIDPLAAGRRGPKVEIGLANILADIIMVFQSQIDQRKIATTINCAPDLIYEAWAQDIYAIFTNLVDNTLYWTEATKISNPIITIDVGTDNKKLAHIDYRDNGPGIDSHLISSQIIFEPAFSTKPGGTGLGLAIAGEAAARNDLELRAFESSVGAWFRLQPIYGDLQ